MSETTSKDKLIQSATREFLECGYSKASLRKICENAGMTTGAVYHFFKGKADMFDSIVGEIAEETRVIIDTISKREVSLEDEYTLTDMSASVLLGETLVDLYFNHPTEAKLLLECSSGSRYENFVGMLHDCIINRLKTLVESRIIDAAGESIYDEKIIDWMTHMEVEGMLHALSLSDTREEAHELIRKTVIYEKAGFNKLYKYQRRMSK